MVNWYPLAAVRPGPAVKKQSGTNTVKGVVCHSMVGYRGGAYSVLDNVVHPRETVAWHFSVMQDGTVEQHYPIDAVLHHAGNAWANNNLIGIEHEGGYSPSNEPLTPSQLKSSVLLVKWIAEQGGWVPSRMITLYEHNEVSDKVTQCPSGRIPWEEYIKMPYTAEQQEMVDYLIQSGPRLTKAEKQRLLMMVGLTLADIDQPAPRDLDMYYYNSGYNDGLRAAKAALDALKEK